MKELRIREWEEHLPEKGNLLFHRFIDNESSRNTINVLNEKKF